MSKLMAVLPVLVFAALVSPPAARAQTSGPSVSSGADAFLSLVMVDPESGTTTLLTVTGYRSTLIQPGQPAQKSLGCEVDITQYDSAGFVLLQGVGSADAGSMTLMINKSLSKATLEATMIFIDFST